MYAHMDCICNFYPRPPRGGRPIDWRKVFTSSNFYPRPPRGGRPGSACRAALAHRFLSTPSARRATCADALQAGRCRYFYPRPPRGGRHILQLHLLHSKTISIHALREEGDELSFSTICPLKNFYPRPPRGGRRDHLDNIRGLVQFLSTPSSRRATYFAGSPCPDGADFYPRPPRGGRPFDVIAKKVYGDISIHALLAEGDSFPPSMVLRWKNFYPRPPRGGRLHGFSPVRYTPCHFYPRPPRGGRQCRRDLLDDSGRISIHALLAEGDPILINADYDSMVFLSTPSSRRATRCISRISSLL